VKVTTYEEWEEEFRERSSGRLPVERTWNMSDHAPSPERLGQIDYTHPLELRIPTVSSGRGPLLQRGARHLRYLDLPNRATGNPRQGLELAAGRRNDSEGMRDRSTGPLLSSFMDICVRCGAAPTSATSISGGRPKNMPVLRAS